jgi:2-desacetyl-2-hydroxyethyl bacteriochlorophyllide A dehydrogenase
LSLARSVWFSAPRSVELRTAEIGPPAPDELLVRAELSAISAGSELLVYRGLAPPELDPDLPTVEGSFSLPIKFGYALVGRVLAQGAQVPERLVGRRVFAFHPHQSELVISAGFAVALPEAVSAEDGVFFANLETALTVVLDAHPRLGETVAVFGQGVVGLLITALLRKTGAGRIIAVDGFARRRQAALELGADLALSPSEAHSERLRALSDERGLDLVIESSGSAEALQTGIDALAFQGTLVASAWYGSKILPLQLGGSFHRRRLRLISSQVSNLDPALTPRWDRARRTAKVLELLQWLRPSRLISHRFELSDAAAAYALLDTAPEQTLQVVLTPSPS